VPEPQVSSRVARLELNGKFGARLCRNADTAPATVSELLNQDATVHIAWEGG